MASNCKSIQIFLKKTRAEQEIIALLGELLGFPVESVDCAIDDAIGFVQVADYAEGFQQGFLVTWPGDVKLRLNANDVIERMARQLNVHVLLEPIETDEHWLLAHPDGALTNATVAYLDDGIDVVPSE